VTSAKIRHEESVVSSPGEFAAEEGKVFTRTSDIVSEEKVFVILGKGGVNTVQGEKKWTCANQRATPLLL